MGKIANETFFEEIISSNILSPYLERDQGLSELIKSPDHPDVHYFENPTPAREIAPALKRRLNVMVTKNIAHNLEATKQLVAFSEEHPDSQIYNVTFNSRTQHYGVRCGVVDGQVHVICAMTGGRIPDELLGESGT
jgi:hypothetical protein